MDVAAPADDGAAAEPEVPEVAKLDIRIGKILQIETHPDADRHAPRQLAKCWLPCLFNYD